MKKRHALFGIFHGCLRDAIFLLNPDDVATRKAMLVAKKKSKAKRRRSASRNLTLQNEDVRGA